jgi:hypothetical protein
MQQLGGPLIWIVMHILFIFSFLFFALRSNQSIVVCNNIVGAKHGLPCLIHVISTKLDFHWGLKKRSHILMKVEGKCVTTTWVHN